MKLYFLLARRVPPVPSQIVLEVSEILRCRGFRVESGIAEEMLVSPDRLASTHDLYLLKSYTALSLSLAGVLRSEEHTSELQSRLHLVCRLLLEKKKRTRRKCLEHLRDDTDRA